MCIYKHKGEIVLKKDRLTKSALVLCLVVCIAVSLAVPAFAKDTGYTPKNWMASIDGSLTLAQFTIPGAHDSATDKVPLGHCQTVGVKQQLNMGARFLDIRLKVDSKGNLNCYHGFVNCLTSFKSVMNDIVSFLKANPTECVIMSVKNEDGDSAPFEKALVEKWIDSSKYAEYFYTENSIPTLDDVRGKIVFMRRYISFGAALKRGINARNWLDNTSFCIDRGSYKINIQDCYEYNTIGLTFGKDKWKNFLDFDLKMQAENTDNPANVLWLNFSSACNILSCGQVSCAAVMNAHLLNAFKNASGNHGVVIMDHVTPCLVNTVIATNFR